MLKNVVIVFLVLWAFARLPAAYKVNTIRLWKIHTIAACSVLSQHFEPKRRASAR
jgi:hypothetical protein